MTQQKICPIILAGVANSFRKDGIGINTPACYNVSYCIKNKCEWYKHGCPVHPITDKQRAKLLVLCVNK